jgi:hypothetical protein
MNKDILKPQNAIILFFSAFLLIYTGCRSSMLSFTHDESYSFIHYVHSSVIDILTYNLNPVIANSHILNTLSMKWMGTIFGNSEFILRFHSFLAHILYLIFTYLILKEIPSKLIVLLGFILLNFNPYLLDFFSLARGYGLSISLMIASIYYFMQFVSYNKNKHLYISLAISVLAVLANFSLITYSASLVILAEFTIIKKSTSTKALLLNNISMVITIVTLFLIYNGPIKVLIDHNELNFGGASGLWFDTVISSICSYLYNSPYFDSFILFLRFLVVFVSIGSAITVYKQYKTNTMNSFSYITIILFFILSASMLQHIFLKGSYFKERFALFLVPLFFFSFLNVVSFMVSKSKPVKISAYVLSVLAIGCSVSIFYSSINLTYCYSWKYDADTKDMITELSNQKVGKKNIRIGNTWLFEPAINFYKETKQLNWLVSANRDGLSGEYDFYYVEWNDLNTFDRSNKTLIKSYPISGASLFKKN